MSSACKWSHDPRLWPSPLPPPVVVAFEAKWGVNKSNIRCIVWHPKGPNEVTLEVQITSGHGLLAFSCSISPRLAGNAPQPPTAAIIQVYLHLGVLDWLNGLLFGIVPPQACLVFKPETTVQRGKGPHILFLKSQYHLTHRVRMLVLKLGHISALSAVMTPRLCAGSCFFSALAVFFYRLWKYLKWDFHLNAVNIYFQLVANSVKLLESFLLLFFQQEWLIWNQGWILSFHIPCSPHFSVLE